MNLQKLALLLLWASGAVAAQSTGPFAQQEEDIKAIEQKIQTLKARITLYQNLSAAVERGEATLMNSHFIAHRNDYLNSVITALQELHQITGEAFYKVFQPTFSVDQEPVPNSELLNGFIADPKLLNDNENRSKLIDLMDEIQFQDFRNVRDILRTEMGILTEKAQLLLAATPTPKNTNKLVNILTQIVELYEKAQGDW